MAIVPYIGIICLLRSKRTTNIRGMGGRRPGAGRKKGSIRRLTAEAIDAAAAEGILPLQYMLRVMRDARVARPRRDAMAIAAAPYLHSKLSSVEHSTKKGETLKEVMDSMTAKEAAEAYATTLSQPSFEDDKQSETKH